MIQFIEALKLQEFLIKKTINFYLPNVKICNEGWYAADNYIPPPISVPLRTIFTLHPIIAFFEHFYFPLLQRALYDNFR
jgi:hypothetical protein